MGELSKSSGELGEFYIANFLQLIGWTSSQSNHSIPCCENDKHKTDNAKGGRQTHGIDELFTYESPMDTNTLIHLVMSVKHTINMYPGSPSSTFKKHMTDLAFAIECFTSSDLIDKNRESTSCGNEQIVGVLFWLSNKSNANHSVISMLNPDLSEDLLYERIHVMDNDRVNFISKSINLIKNKFIDYEFNFYYIDTPTNLADKDKQYSGKKLPVEMLNSDIQLFRLQKGIEIVLAIVVKDEFSTDSLKRIFGLAHRISSNFASNIYIFFPSFEHTLPENQNMLKSVKDFFREEELISSINVYGYDLDPYKDVNILPLSANTKQTKEFKESEVDYGKSLPYGEYLRTLISRSVISEGELKSLLRKKGIYVCNPIKEQTIPILSSLLLSPREFDDLKEHQKTREDKEKRMTSQIKAQSMPTMKNLKKILNTIDFNEVANSKFSNYKFTTAKANFKALEDGNDNKVVLTYEIERYERNKAWDEQVNFFKGAVVFDYNGQELNITSQSRFTSKETQEINKSIIDHCITKLKKENVISLATKEEKILMKNMTNPEVIQFLLAFTDNVSLTKMKFTDITSLDVEIDDSTDLPNNTTLKWMEKKIKKLKLNGKKIDDTELITNSTNHPYLRCWGIVVEYEYSQVQAQGTATVKLEFNTSHGGEFTVNIETKKFDRKLYSGKIIDELILSDIENIKLKKYKEIIDKRPNP